MATRLLLIDSDADFSRELKGALQALGFEVEVTTDTESAIQLAKIDPPTAVVIGMMDARGTGYGLCSKLRRRVPDLPVLMVIDEAEAESDRLKRHQMLKTRAQAYLVRPFTVQSFHDTLSDSLAKPLPARTEDLSARIGVRQTTEAALGDLLFSADELDAIAEEADRAFDSLMTGPLPEVTAPQPPAAQPDAAVEFALTDEDLEELPLDGADSLAGDPDLLALDRDFADFMDEPTTENFSPSALLGGRRVSDLPPLPRPPVKPAPAPAPVPTPTEDAGHGSRDDLRALRARVVEVQQEARLAHEELAQRRDDASRRRAAENASRKEAMQLRGKLSEREKEIAELRTQIDGRDREIIGLNEALDDRRADLEMAKSDLRHAEARAAAAESARVEAEAEIKRLEVLLTQAQGDLAAVEQDLEVAQGETAAAIAAGEAALEAARQAHSAERAAQDEGHIIALAAAQADTETARGETEQRLLDQREAFDLELDTLRRAHEAQIAEVEARGETERTAAADEYIIAITELTAKHGEAIEAKDAEREAAVTAEAKAHAAALEALEGKIAELESAAEGIEQAHAEALAEQRAEVEAAQELLDSVAAEHAAALTALAATHAEALAAQRGELEMAAETASTEHAQALQAREEAHQVALDEADERFLTETSKLDERVEQLETDLKAASDARATLSLSLTEAQTAVEVLTTRADEAEAALTEERRLRTDDVAERDAKVLDLTEQTKVHLTRLSSLERSVEGLNEEIEVWEAEVGQREDEVAALKASLAERDERLAAADGELSARNAEIAEITAEREAVQAELDGLQHKAHQLDELIEKARSAMGVARAFLEHTRPEGDGGADV